MTTIGATVLGIVGATDWAVCGR